MRQKPAPIVGRRPAAFGHHPGLDGIRGLAVAAVLLYHGGVTWAGGGFIGVEVFFVLSGFLITTILVNEWRRTGTIAVRAFWGRRARRLLPALLCLVVVVGIYYSRTSPDRFVPGLEADGLATLLYFGNWHQLAAGSGYFAANGAVSPLEHTWSLAIEEQFYVVWPLVALAVLLLASRLRRGDHSAALRVLLAVAGAGLLASAVDSILLIHGGVNRVYLGTDTRAAGLLAGASLALVLSLVKRDVDARARVRSGAPRALVALAPFVALVGILGAMHAASGTGSWLYPYGLLAVDLAVAGLIAATVLSPSSPIARALGVGPLRKLGEISYGVYLWHLPLFLWLDETSTGIGGTPLLAVRLAVTLVVALLSFHLVEQPIRQRRIPNRLVRSLAPVAASGAVAALLLAASAESSAALGSASVPATPSITASLRGNAGPCLVRLKDTSAYGLSPLSPTQAASDEPAWLVGHRLRWNSTSRVSFRTCPPKRVLVIGDSIAFTLGVGLMENEQAYGVEVADAAILGCAFNNRGQLNSRGKWEQQYAGCPDALHTWAVDERALRAQAVVIELGYRDEFNWRIAGRLEHVGQPAYDAYLSRRLEDYVRTLGAGGTPILFLSVPWSSPPALADGSPAPEASPTRHTAINQSLAAVAARHPGQVRLLDLDQIVSPGNRYNARLNGKLCRFDGVHFTVYCSRVLQPAVLTAARAMIGG